MAKPINKSFARALLDMSLGESLNASKVTDKKALKLFKEEGIIRKVPVKGRRYRFVVNDPQALSDYLRVNYQIHSLENYLQLFDREEVSGVDALKASYATKTQRSAVMSGFFADANQPVEIAYGDEIIRLPAPEDTGVFVFEPEKLALNPEMVIVGVENPEVFRNINRLPPWFDGYKPSLFVLRYMGKGLTRWLQGVTNPYLHFGDFDLAGLAIYIREYADYLPANRCKFFIPKGIEKDIATHGNRELYEKQYQYTRSIDFSHYPEVKELAEVIKRERKGLEQESLLR